MNVARSDSTRADVGHGRQYRPLLTWFVVAGSTVAALFLANSLGGRLVIFNASPSVAPGFYVACDCEPSVGKLVEFRLPVGIRSAFPNVPVCAKKGAQLLKPIAAGPGDHVDTTGDWLLINGRTIAPILTVDSKGRPSPVWRASCVLGPTQYFVYSDRVARSWDSRYFGLVQRTDIMAVRQPLWTWNEHVQAIADAPEPPIPSGSP